MLCENQKYVIGIDGGGVDTVVALADLKGKILKESKTGPSHFIKAGLKESISNITEAIEKVMIFLTPSQRKEIVSTFIGLTAIEENKEIAKVIKKLLSQQSRISEIFKGRVTVGSDQIAGFRSGTDKKEGVVLISGAGCAAHGWGKNKEFKTSGWGYLNDEGSGFWIGQEGFRAVYKDLDGRGPKTLITQLVSQKLKLKKIEDLKKKVYTPALIQTILSFSILVDRASKKNDQIAKNILIKAGQELALATKTVIKKLNFRKKKFPLVLSGKMFKSKIVLDVAKKEIKKFAPKVQFILPRQEPVIGAIKLALERAKRINPLLPASLRPIKRGGARVLKN